MPDVVDNLSHKDQLTAASCVGYLMLLAGDDAPLDPSLMVHVQRFVKEAGLDAPGLSDEDRQARVDAFFVAHPVPADFLAAFQANVDDIKAEGQAVEARRAQEAKRLLGENQSLTPVGHNKDPKAMRGGIAGLMAAKLGQPKKH